jgi:hypothetical protein
MTTEKIVDLAFQTRQDRRFDFIAVCVTFGKGSNRVTEMHSLNGMSKTELAQNIEDSIQRGGVVECLLGINDHVARVTAIPLDGIKPRCARLILANVMQNLQRGESLFTMMQ